MSNEDDTPKPAQDPKNGRFLPGNNGGGGRPKGSRGKLGEAFICDMYEAWTDPMLGGAELIKRVMADDPASFLRSMVAILPKEVDVTVSKLDGLTDDQLKSQFLAALREAHALGLDVGVGIAAGPDQAPEGKPARPVPALH